MNVASTPASGRMLVSSKPFWLQPTFVAVLGAMSFNFVLCFVNTSIVNVGTSTVIGCEIAIISAILLYSYPTLDYTRLIVISSAMLYLLTLVAARALLGGALDIKPIRDLLIPIAFFMLGAGAGNISAADRIVRAAAFLVIAVGLFEYFFPDTFIRFFNIASFYIERGTMDATQAQQSSSLFVSGMRPEGANAGRNLLPFLGNHRVSSIFLEPISTGNFGIIVFLWALIRSMMERRPFWGLFASAAFVIIMSDSRFGAYFCGICLMLALLPAIARLVVTALLPAFGLFTITFLPDALPGQYGVDNGFIGRIILSGRVLERFDALNWLGLKAPNFVMSDSGYAYALAGFGIIGLIAFWIMLMSIKGKDSRFDLFRDMAGAYVAFLLCISNSPFTIKTGALLWFLTGVLSRRANVRSIH